jgi:hypothetical protein
MLYLIESMVNLSSDCFPVRPIKFQKRYVVDTFPANPGRFDVRYAQCPGAARAGYYGEKHDEKTVLNHFRGSSRT